MEIKKLNYGWGVKLAVLLIICVQYTVTITSPILGTIMEAFPEHASMVKLLETIPTFAAVIISILLGPLMKVFYKKQLLLFGIALSFFQFIPAIVPGFWPLFICRTVAGFGIGFMYSFAASFAVDMFDEKGAADMLGLRSTGRCHGHRLSAASARFAVASGSYQRSFMVALILVPIFLYILFMMPKSCPVEDYNREQAKLPHEEKAKEKIYYPLTIALLGRPVPDPAVLLRIHDQRLHRHQHRCGSWRHGHDRGHRSKCAVRLYRGHRRGRPALRQSVVPYLQELHHRRRHPVPLRRHDHQLHCRQKL